MPYWLLVAHDGAANLVAGYINGFVYLLETLGVSHGASVDLATGLTVAMICGIVAWTWGHVRALSRRAAEAARQRLRREPEGSA
jgi:hypothetical protein